MFFRRHRKTESFPQPEAVEISIEDVKVLERVLLHAKERQRIMRPDIGGGLNSAEDRLIARLYQSAGAASVTEPDQEAARVPLMKGDFFWLEAAISGIRLYHGNPTVAAEGQQLLNKCNALLGRARALREIEGTWVFRSSGGRTLPCGTSV
ncbi:hypothetical protein ABZ569_32760 [Streptomyces albus]|uniref:hypothetical protein n=1 Tax=Streptomyces albus TaxID=1888 RepID=UPI0033E0A92D